SMIRLTVARYYTPAGRCIQKPYESTADTKLSNGKSDESNIEKYQSDLMQRYNRGEMVSADSIHFPDSLKSQTKKLQRTVYGGGGIMPDYFVPVDTTLYSDYHRNLVAKGVIIRLVAKFIEGNRKELAGKYKKFDTYNQKFEVDDQLLATLREMADKEKIAFNETQYNTSLPLIKTQLKALIARDLWDMNEYFQVMNQANKSVERALEILNSNEYKQKLNVSI
ncbi:MAG: peptidase S41, partial [Bacteroides sp.]